MKVYFNNSCKICRSEINLYKKENIKEIEWIDITNNSEAEKETSFDIGYRFNSKDFTVDVNAYYSDYENFIGTNSVYVPIDGSIAPSVAMSGSLNQDYLQFGVDANLDVPFSTYGLSVEAIKRFSPMLSMNLIYEYNNLDYEAEANSFPVGEKATSIFL